MEEFAAGVQGIFEETTHLQQLIMQADTQLGQVRYNANAGIIDYTRISGEWRNLIQETDSKYLLLWNGFTKEDIKEIGRLGFSCQEMRYLYDSIANKEEKRWMLLLIQKEYSELFREYPPKGDVIRAFFPEYMVRISSLEKGEENLEEIFNAMFKSSLLATGYVPVFTKDNCPQAKEYLRLLSGGTQNLLEIETSLLFCRKGIGEELYQKVRARNEVLQALVTLYQSQYNLLVEAGTEAKPRGEFPEQGGNTIVLFNISLHGLTWNENRHAYSYTLQYQRRFMKMEGDWWQEQKTVSCEKSVEGYVLKNPISWMLVKDGEEYKALLAARSMAQITAVQDTLALALVLGLSTAHPLAGATAGLLWALISRSTSATNIYSLNALQKSGLGGEIIQEKLNHPAAMASVRIINKIFEHKKKLDKMQNEIEENSNLQMSKLFVTGAGYHVDGEDIFTISGIHDPDIIEKIAAWQEGGLDGLLERAGVEHVPLKELKIDGKRLIFGRSDKLVPMLYNKIEMKDFFKEDEGCQILWDGGNIMDMDVNTFSDAFLKVTAKYDEITHMELPWGSIFMNEN